MKFFSKKNIYLFLISCLLVFLGFYRDFIFKSINALLKAWDADMDYSMPSSLTFLENYEYDTLLTIKWGLTLLFTLMFLSISLLTIQLLFKNKKYLKITLFTYVIIIIVSYSVYLTGSNFKGFEYKAYLFSRYFMGMAQSPIILMILIPAFKLSERENRNITN